MAWYSAKDLLRWKSMPQPAVFITPQLFNILGEIDSSLYYALDYEYFFRAWAKDDLCQRYIYIPAVLAISREYSDTKMGSGREKVAEENLGVLEKNWANKLQQHHNSDEWKKAYAIGVIQQALRYHLYGYPNKAISLYWRAIKHSPTLIFYLAKKLLFLILDPLRGRIL